MSNKNYIIDTNVLLENPKCLEILSDNGTNKVFIPYTVLDELDKLKKEPRVSHLVNQVISTLLVSDVVILESTGSYDKSADERIIKEILYNQREKKIEFIFVTNDRILQLKCRTYGIKVESFKDSFPYVSDSQRYTGIIDPEDDDKPYNYFIWENGTPVFYSKNNEPISLNFQHEVWKVKPKNIYQNMAFTLLLHDDIDLVSLQSQAGMGKTFLSLAAAFYLVFEKKKYKKIYIVKPTIEIGESIGYLPGAIEDKLEPYIKYIRNLVEKLHSIRPVNRIFIDSKNNNFEFNPKYFEILPLGFVRGMTLEDCICLADEAQNMSRFEVRALLTRMGENVKCFCLGDTEQVDNPRLNQFNNGLNWIVRKFRKLPNYAHLVLKGKRSRGPITDMVLKTGL